MPIKFNTSTVKLIVLKNKNTLEQLNHKHSIGTFQQETKLTLAYVL